jgi:tRNA threonylcarbamoyl adenosine modification protein YeaZ
VLVLALDTATPAVTTGVVEVTPDAVVVRAVQVARDARKHAELLMPNVLAVCADAGVALRDLAAVVTGTGPGPFTGLRVGMMTAAALGDALDVPVHGVCSLDAIAAEAEGTGASQRALASEERTGPGSRPSEAEAGTSGPLAVVVDARRREVYWAVYDAGERVAGPGVDAPATVAARARELGVTAAAGTCAHVLGVPVRAPAEPGPAGLVACAAAALRAGVRPAPPVPLYLRRPDAVAPGPRKPVTAP